jgi:hypothetical protein
VCRSRRKKEFKEFEELQEFKERSRKPESRSEEAAGPASARCIPEPTGFRVIGKSVISFPAMFLLRILLAGQGLIESFGRLRLRPCVTTSGLLAPGFRLLAPLLELLELLGLLELLPLQ